MGAPVVHWEINSNNAERLQEFYAKLFGWNVNSNNPMHYGLVNTGTEKGAQGGIGQNDPNQPAGPPVLFYMEVPDLQETLNKAVSLGGTIVMQPMEIPNMVTFALFRDPDGNTLGIVKSEEPKPAPRKKTRKAAARKTPKKKSAPKKLRGRKR
ncbi:MAG: VOC family protein [Ignavibacteriae bacterium]|nr:VOC family protein [Ignavibacteriota bacterium]